MPTSNIIKIISTVMITLLMLSFCVITAAAAETVDVSGSADVEIESVSSDHSQGAAAVAALDGRCNAILKSEFFCPGAWASFDITVENRGSSTARLSDVIKQDNTSENIIISFGISDSKNGELLAAGDRCTVTVVAQVNPDLSASVLEENGDFSLTLIYDAVSNNSNSENDGSDSSAEPEQSPSTGVSRYQLIFWFILISAAVITLILLRSRHSDKLNLS